MKTVRNTVLKLTLASVAMFGFGYALVPLYDVFCEITGLNGKTGQITADNAGKLKADTSRLITVEFDTNVNSELPWEFGVKQRTLEVHPGSVYEAVFYVKNLSDRHTVGQAVPSVAPSSASRSFNKTECFCFSRQPLAPGEAREMLVRFVVETDLPDAIRTLTLSYTFFPLADAVTSVQNDIKPKS